MPAGPGGKDVVDEMLAHDSFHGPAEAGHVREVDVARAFNHAARIARESYKIKGCAKAGCSLVASTGCRWIHCNPIGLLIVPIRTIDPPAPFEVKRLLA